jgi:cystathionine beta-synthase
MSTNLANVNPEGITELTVRPNLPSTCSWHLVQDGKDALQSPHTIVKRSAQPKILPNILEHIGNTPMVRLNTIPAAKGIKCEVCK